MVGVDEHRVTEIEERPRHVSELERRVSLGGAELSDSYQAADGVGVGDAGEAEIRLRLRPPPRTGKSFARASDLVIGTRQLVPDGGVELGAPQGVGRMPGDREQESRVANDR